MAKKLGVALALILIVCSVLCLVACDGDEGGVPNEPNNGETPTPPSDNGDNGNNASDGGEPSNSDKKTFSGITFEGKSVDYDGTEHSILIGGAALPEGATVNYSGNKGTDAGSYEATATVTCEGYETKTLNATLVINKINITGVTLSGQSFDYDTNKKTIAVTGAVPSGVTVSYSGGEDGKNGASNVGTYTVKATLSGANYNTLTLNATLTVNKINIQGITFESKSFDYDTNKKTITVTGVMPSGVTVSYSGGEDGKNGATSVGKYTVTATLSGRNYNTLTLTATLTVKSEEELLTMVSVGDKIYFQNSLDKNKLYSYSGGTLSKVNDDVANAMIRSETKVYYISKSLLSKTVTSLDASEEDKALFDASAEMLVTDGTYLYYNVNSLTSADKTGIWRIKISDLEDSSIDAAAERVTAVKSEWLVYANGNIYFSNKSDGGKLYAVKANKVNAEPTLIFDYKISDMITDVNKLYFTKHTLTGAAIFSIDVSAGTLSKVNDDSASLKKITVSNGKYLVKINDYIYFVNCDLLTSSLFGDGIYKAKADGSGLVGDVTSLLSGATKVVDGADDNLFSLATDGSSLYYYRASSKHLVCLDLKTMQETDLMEGFTPPVYNPVISTFYEKTALLGTDIYFINMRDGGKLYKYDTVTGAEYRITGMEVADFAIYGNYIYYTSVKLKVNFDLYRMSVITGETEMISKDKCMNFSFVGDKIYYNNFSGSNTLNRMNLDGSGDEVIFNTKSVDENATVVYNGELYFVADDYFYKYNLTSGTVTLISDEMKPLEYIIYGGKILLMNCKGATNSIGIYDIASDTVTKLDGLGFSGVSDDIRGMFIYNNAVYYYRNRAVESGDKGLYKVSLTAATPTPELVTEAEGYRLCNSIVIGNKLYFINVWRVKDTVPSNQSDANCAKLCVMDLTTNAITVLN